MQNEDRDKADDVQLGFCSLSRQGKPMPLQGLGIVGCGFDIVKGLLTYRRLKLGN